MGHRCVGAKINGKIVPLDYPLKNGDIVEIITSKVGKPSMDWLKIVGSSESRTKIRNWFKRENREENLEKGLEALEKECCLLYTSPSPRDLSTSRMPSSA